MGIILRDVLAKVRLIIGKYWKFLERTRRRDEISHRLVLDLLGNQVACESESGKEE